MISRQEVKHLAELAHLELSDAELEKLTKDLGLILDYISQLKEVDVSGVGPMAGGHSLANRFRLDEPEAGRFAFELEQLRAQFPQRQGDYNKVPRVLVDHQSTAEESEA